MAANWKTTTAGVLAVFITIATAVLPWLQNGSPVAWGTIAAGVMTGIGLIAARDHDGPMTPTAPEK